MLETILIDILKCSNCGAELKDTKSDTTNYDGIIYDGIKLDCAKCGTKYNLKSKLNKKISYMVSCCFAIIAIAMYAIVFRKYIDSIFLSHSLAMLTFIVPTVLFNVMYIKKCSKLEKIGERTKQE